MQEHGMDFPLKTFAICWVWQEVVPQVGEHHAGSVGTAIISMSVSCGLMLDGDVPSHYLSKPAGGKLGPRPSRNPLPFFVQLLQTISAVHTSQQRILQSGT